MLFRFFIYCFMFLFTHIEVKADLLNKLSYDIKKILGKENFSIFIDQNILNENFEDIKDIAFQDNFSKFIAKIGDKEVSGKIEWKAFIPVLSSDKRPGDIISSSEIEFKEFMVKNIEQTTCLTPDEIIDKTPKTFIKAGLPINKKELRNEYLIKKGERITILLDRPGFSIQSNAIAIENGSIGDQILVEPVDNFRKKIKVTVSEKGLAKL